MIRNLSLRISGKLDPLDDLPAKETVWTKAKNDHYQQIGEKIL